MADVKSAGAYVELSLRSEKFTKGLLLAERRLAGIGTSIQSAGRTLSLFGAAGVAAFIPAIKAATDFQENMSKFETVFGEQSEAIKQFASDTAEQLGRSEADIRQFLASAQDLFVPIGFDAAKATELSKTITQLAVDLASFNNVADADALRDLTGALTGSSELMKKYGVIVNEAAVKQQLLNEGLDPTKASEQEKVLARLNVILAGTTAAQGDAAKTSGSFANQLKRLNGQVKDASIEVGNALLPSLTKVVVALNSGAKQIKAWVTENQDLIRTAFLVAAGITAVGGALILVGVAFKGFAAALGVLASPLVLMKTVFAAVVPLVSALITPFGLLATAAVALGVAFGSSLGNAGQVVDWLRDRIGTLVGDFKTALGAIGELLTGGDVAGAARILWLTIKLEFDKGVSYLNDAWTQWKAFFLNVWAEATYDLAGIFTTAIASLESAWANVTGYILDTWTVVTSGITTAWLTAQEIIATGIIKLGGLLSSEFDVQGALDQLNARFDKDRADIASERNNQITERDTARRNRLDAINAQRDQILEQLELDRQAKLKAIGDGERANLDKTEKSLKQAREEWQRAVSAVAGGPEAGGAAGGDNPLANLRDALQGAQEAIGKSSLDAISQRTTFGGQRAGQIFGSQDQVAKQQLDIQKKQLQEQQKIAKSLQNAGNVFA